MVNKQKQAGAFSYGDFTWWLGVVENRDDPEKLGRLQVRVYGYNTDDLGDIPTSKLYWAVVITPITSASVSGVGVSPTGIVEGSHVIGFFADGADGQVPIIFGTYQAKTPKKIKGKGFTDPNDVYPKYEEKEPDCNRLARNEKIDKTIVKKRKDSVAKNVKTAFGVSWNEKPTPYAAKYPYNHVRETESGHVEEFDDTEGAERYMLWHKAGTFEEIHPDGTKVVVVKKDNYELVYGDNFVKIAGVCNVTIEGNSNLRVNGNANIEVDGNCKEQIHGNYELTVDGNMDLNVGGHQYSTTGTHEKRTSPRIDLN